MIALAMLINKVTGLYGLLAILTGYHISVTQLSMYIYSVLALVALASCLPHIRKQTPFQCLALAWLYIIDTIVNTLYITNFAVTWYLASEESSSQPAKGEPTGADMSPEVSKFLSAVDDTASTVFIVAFSVLRIYFVLVVMSYARSVLTQHTEAGRQVQGGDADEVGMVLDPFAKISPEGQGWKGKLGRTMTSVGRSYWLVGEKPTATGTNYHRVKASV